MYTPQESELLSAYLDGELTAAERELVERRLAEDAAYRQLHDDLLAIKQRFATLPKHHLEADFSQRVLEAAERQRVVPQQRTAGESAGQSGRPSKARDNARGEQPRWVRPLVWSGMAVAAALALMWFNPTQKPQQANQLAKSKPEAAQQGANQEKDEGRDQGKLAAAPQEQPARDLAIHAPADAQAPLALKSQDAQLPAAEAAGTAATPPAIPAGSTVASAPATAAPAAAEAAKSALGKMPANRPNDLADRVAATESFEQKDLRAFESSDTSHFKRSKSGDGWRESSERVAGASTGAALPAPRAGAAGPPAIDGLASRQSVTSTAPGVPAASAGKNLPGGGLAGGGGAGGRSSGDELGGGQSGGSQLVGGGARRGPAGAKDAGSNDAVLNDKGTYDSEKQKLARNETAKERLETERFGASAGNTRQAERRMRETSTALTVCATISAAADQDMAFETLLGDKGIRSLARESKAASGKKVAADRDPNGAETYADAKPADKKLDAAKAEASSERQDELTKNETPREGKALGIAPQRVYRVELTYPQLVEVLAHMRSRQDQFKLQPLDGKENYAYARREKSPPELKQQKELNEQLEVRQDKLLEAQVAEERPASAAISHDDLQKDVNRRVAALSTPQDAPVGGPAAIADERRSQTKSAPKSAASSPSKKAIAGKGPGTEKGIDEAEKSNDKSAGSDALRPDSAARQGAAQQHEPVYRVEFVINVLPSGETPAAAKSAIGTQSEPAAKRRVDPPPASK